MKKSFEEDIRKILPEDRANQFITSQKHSYESFLNFKKKQLKKKRKLTSPLTIKNVHNVKNFTSLQIPEEVQSFVHLVFWVSSAFVSCGT